MCGSELRCAPHGDRVVVETDVDPARHGEQLSVCVPSDQEGAVSQLGEAVQDVRWLRPPGVIASHDDQLRAPHGRLIEDSVECGQHPVDIRQDSDARHHARNPATHARWPIGYRTADGWRDDAIRLAPNPRANEEDGIL